MHFTLYLISGEYAPVYSLKKKGLEWILPDAKQVIKAPKKK